MSRLAILGRNAVLAVVLAGGMAFSARAQEISGEHLAAARAAIDALAVTGGYNNILPGLAEQLKAEFIQASPHLETQIADVVDGEALALAPRRADLEREAASIYARNFTIDELKTIASFFGTEAGKKLMSTGPQISRELSRAAEIWANGVSRDLTDQATAKLRSILDSGSVQAPSADPAVLQPGATQPGG